MTRRNISRQRVVVCAVFALASMAACHAVAQSLNQGLRPVMSVGASELRGVVLFSDGRTPVTKFDVKVWDAARERYVYKTRTDSGGNFRIPGLNAGRFYLIVGRMTIDLEFLMRAAQERQQPHDIIIALPRPFLVASPTVPILPVFFFVPPNPPKVVSP